MTRTVFITGGSADPVGGEKGMTRLAMHYMQTLHQRVKLKIYPEGRHEMLNEVNREAVTADWLDWIELRDVARDAGRPVGILQDLGGPKIRLGELPANGVTLSAGDEVALGVEEKAESVTVGGFVAELLGRVPRVDDVVVVGRDGFVIESSGSSKRLNIDALGAALAGVIRDGDGADGTVTASLVSTMRAAAAGANLPTGEGR